MLILDVHPPGPRDPQGIHGAIWADLTSNEYTLSPNRPLTLASYEAAGSLRAFVDHLAVGEKLPDVPLFLMWDRQVPVPLEKTYQAAFAVLPRRWQAVLERSANS